MARGVGGHGPANVMKHMKGIDFPARKKDLIAHAKKAPGPDTNDVIEVLNRIEDKEYHSPAEVMKELSEAAYSE
ncbi:MAG: DUF2795 domain-containing protein [Desulfobacteraceae bacterium]|nr:DUF2795 domain-containing protein [Desulfobacteraceae bacterium]